MYEILAVFRSRSQAMDCYTKMRAFNIPAQIINTPKEANVGCGLSIKFPFGAAARAKNVISRGTYTAFYGYMKIEYKNGRMNFR